LGIGDWGLGTGDWGLGNRREHLKEAKKTVVGWRSLCGASERLAPGGIGLGSETLPLLIYENEPKKEPLLI